MQVSLISSLEFFISYLAISADCLKALTSKKIYNPFRTDANHLQKQGLFICRVEKCLNIKYGILFPPDKHILTDLAFVQDYVTSECLLASGTLRNFIVMKFSKSLSLSVSG